MDKKIAELIEKHINDFGDYPSGRAYFGNLLYDAVREGSSFVKELIGVFNDLNIDVDGVVEKQFNEKYCMENDAIYDRDKTTLIRFCPMSSIKEIDIKCHAASRAFLNCNIKKIIVKDNVKTLGSYVFKNCKNLTEVIFENGETSLDNCCFEGCSDSLVIKAPAGGYVEEYAKKYNLKFEGI